MTPLKPGQWTTVSAPLSTYTDPAKVQLLHFVVRTNGQGFRGEIGLDAFSLGDGDAPLGEWDGADLEGWQVSPDKDTKSIKAPQSLSFQGFALYKRKFAFLAFLHRKVSFYNAENNACIVPPDS